MTALVEAVTIIGEVRVQRLLVGDRDTAARLAELVRHLHEEDEYLEGVEKHELSLTHHEFPAGATVGWLLRHDPHVRRLRELRGLPVPVTP